jgi:hypothetical protein
MADEVIRSRLEFDASSFVAATQVQTQEVAKVATAADLTWNRILAAAKRLKEVQVEASQLEGIVAAGAKRATRSMVRGLAISAAVPIVSELGIPEAAAPLVHVGMAAWSGAMMGGPVGAGVFASIATVTELVKYVKRNVEKTEELKARVLQFEARQREIDSELRRKQTEMEWQIKIDMNQARIDADQRWSKREYDTSRLVASGLQ